MEQSKGNNVPSSSIANKQIKAQEELDKKKIKEAYAAKQVAKTKKESDEKSFWREFISNEAKDTKRYLIFDVLVPALKKTIVDATNGAINMVLYGDAKKSPPTTMQSPWPGNRVNYGTYYISSTPQPQQQKPQPQFPQKPTTIFDNIVVSSRGEAESIRTGIAQLIGRYGVATVADLYEMARLTPPYTANKYGWFDIDNSYISESGNGWYEIVMPQCHPLD